MLDADILVEIRPVDSFPAADQPPIPTLAWRRMNEPGIPRQRYRNRPSVGEIDGECVVADRHAFGARRPPLNRRSAHPTLSGVAPRWRGPVREYVPVRSAGSRHPPEDGQDRAKPWRALSLVPREHAEVPTGRPRRRRTGRVQRGERLARIGSGDVEYPVNTLGSSLTFSGLLSTMISPHDVAIVSFCTAKQFISWRAAHGVVPQRAAHDVVPQRAVLSGPAVQAILAAPREGQ